MMLRRPFRVVLMFWMLELCACDSSARPDDDSITSEDAGAKPRTDGSGSDRKNDSGSDPVEMMPSVTPPVMRPIDAGNEGGPTASTDAEAGIALSPPSVSSVDPTTVSLGSEVHVSGTNFLRHPRVRFKSLLSNVPLISATDSSLVFAVPTDLFIESCERPVELIVGNDDGEAPPIILKLVQPAPTIDPGGPGTVIAGTETTWTGQALANAKAASPAATLSSRASYDQIAITVPRDAVVGPTDIRVSNGCGELSVPVEIRPRVPEIVSVDLHTVAHNGVLFIKGDFGARTSIRGVTLGDIFVTTDDAQHFAWPNIESREFENVMAVRIPEQLAPVAFDLSLEGVTGRSRATNIKYIVEDANEFHPPPAKQIFFITPDVRFASFLPTNADFDDPLQLADDRVPPRAAYQTWYIDGDFDEDGGVAACLTSARFSTYEVVCTCENCDCDLTRCYGENCSRTQVDGKYALDAKTNLVDMSRDPSAMSHLYQGGWVYRSAIDAAHISADLVVRSLRTGVQHVIHQTLTRQCD